MTVPSEGPAGDAHQLLGEGDPEAMGAMTFPATPGPLPKAQGPSWSPLGVPEDRNTESLTLRTDRSTESPAGARLHPQMPNAITPSLFQLTSQGGEAQGRSRVHVCVPPRTHAWITHLCLRTCLRAYVCPPAFLHVCCTPVCEPLLMKPLPISYLPAPTSFNTECGQVPVTRDKALADAP